MRIFNGVALDMRKRHCAQEAHQIFGNRLEKERAVILLARLDNDLPVFYATMKSIARDPSARQKLCPSA